MKQTFFAAVAALALAACNDAATDAATVSNDSANISNNANNSEEAREERNKQMALASIEGVNKGDADAVLKNADMDIIDYGDGSMPPSKGLDSSKAMLKAWLAAIPDFKGSDLMAVADGDYVMVSGTWSGTWKKDLMGMKATGKSFTFKDVDIYKFNDAGKMTEHRGVQSMNDIARQIGMKMPTP